MRRTFTTALMTEAPTRSCFFVFDVIFIDSDGDDDDDGHGSDDDYSL